MTTPSRAFQGRRRYAAAGAGHCIRQVHGVQEDHRWPGVCDAPPDSADVGGGDRHPGTPIAGGDGAGRRVSLARSETAPVGSALAFTVTTLGRDVDEGVLREWLDYGALRGMGQWRNGGYGRFEYTLTAA